MEMSLTGILCLAYAAALDERHAAHHDSIAVRFGLIVAGLAMSGAEISSSSLNPARSLGPAIVQNVWRNHWVFWVGPLSGSFLGSMIYRIVFRDRRKEDQDSLAFTTD